MIKVIKTDININKVINQLKKYPQDWDHQKHLENSHSLIDRGFAKFANKCIATYNRCS
jgi:hypothetical protein